MTADVMQTAVVALIVLAAVAYVGRTLWSTLSSARRAKKGGGCATGCGCGAAADAEGERRKAAR